MYYEEKEDREGGRKCQGCGWDALSNRVGREGLMEKVMFRLIDEVEE